MRATGLEPARFWQWNLNPPSLPIPPCPHRKQPSRFCRGFGWLYSITILPHCQSAERDQGSSDEIGKSRRQMIVSRSTPWLPFWGNVINLRRFRRGRCPQKALARSQIQPSLAQKRGISCGAMWASPPTEDCCTLKLTTLPFGGAVKSLF